MPAYPRGLPAANLHCHHWIAGNILSHCETLHQLTSIDSISSFAAMALCDTTMALALRVHHPGRREFSAASPLDMDPSLVDDVVIWVSGFSTTDRGIFRKIARRSQDDVLAESIPLDLQAKLVDISIARQNLVVAHHYRCACATSTYEKWYGSALTLDSQLLLTNGYAVQEHPVAL